MELTMKDTDAAWLAGLLETRGSIGQKKSGKYTYPLIVLNLENEVLVRRFAALTGSAVYEIENKGWQPGLLYRAELVGSKAQPILDAIGPYLTRDA